MIKFMKEHRINLRVDDVQRTLIERAAREKGLTMSNFIRMAAVEIARKTLEEPAEAPPSVKETP